MQLYFMTLYAWQRGAMAQKTGNSINSAGIKVSI
jgi:hypothetical protein